MRQFRYRHVGKRAKAGRRPNIANCRHFRGPAVRIIFLAIAAGGAYIWCVMIAIDEIVQNFALLDEWDDRYRYVIELGRTLAPLADSAHIDANKVQGCASQVWLLTHVKPNGSAGPVLSFEGDSDAHIVRGLIAILLALYSGKSAREILAIDALALFDSIGLRENLTPQRSNGLRSMVERIRTEAKAALAAVA
jgi:cysteine desulfuration protein SufE